MLYKFFNKKGNITVILIGVISVMLLMTAAVSRRMSGHTRLLTISDHTQICRYFLESYMNDVMQQMRASVNEDSDFARYIVNTEIDTLRNIENLNEVFKYKPSKILKSLENISGSLKITCDYEPEIKIISEKDEERFETDYMDKLKKYCEIGYPDDKIKNDGKNGKKEKRGFISIVCKCVFDKKEYTLSVMYPFSIVFRMTPILKDFMLFADNIYEEQRAEVGLKYDKINLLYVEEGQVKKDIIPSWAEANISKPIRPLVLLQPPDRRTDQSNDEKKTGMVFLGPSDKAVFLNLAGITPDTRSTNNNKAIDGSELYLVSPESIGLSEINEDGEPIIFPLSIQESNCVKAYGSEIEVTSGGALMGVFGFCKEVPELFENNDKYDLKMFLNEGTKVSGTYWGKIQDQNPDNFGEYLSFASGIKLFGFRNENLGIPKRQIFGNVFARFIVLTFWNPASAMGEPLIYDQELTIEQVPKAEGRYNGKPVSFVPKDDTRSYQKFMSRIMSGMDFDKYTNYPDMFMPINFNYDLGTREILKGDKFEALDGFYLNKIKLDNFSNYWFDSSNDDCPLNQRIGRAFADGDKFKEAVGYNKTPKEFMINGVVYVKGNLDLSEGMDLTSENCSGGIVLVDGDIRLGNITRGDRSLDASKFVLISESSPALEHYKKWTDPNKDNGKYYIGADKILTFVCLKNSITVEGNILLGVHLVNFTNSNEQIKWETKDTSKDIIFYGALACNRLGLAKTLENFGKLKSSDPNLDAPFFFYPPVMATSTPPLAVQINTDMHSYDLTSEEIGENH